MVTGVPESLASWGPFPLMNVARVHLTLLATAAAPKVSSNWSIARSPGRFLHAVDLQSPCSCIGPSHTKHSKQKGVSWEESLPHNKNSREMLKPTLCALEGGQTAQWEKPRADHSEGRS